MRNVIVYESMYGNTRQVAESIAAGLAETCPDTVALPIAEADVEAIAAADLVVIGGPTHAFGMTRPETRAKAVQDAGRPDRTLHLEAGAAAGPGVREWLAIADLHGRQVAVFDTKVRIPGAPHASAKMARELRAKDCTLIAAPESFVVTKQNVLKPDELARAHDWGRTLARVMTSAVNG